MPRLAAAVAALLLFACGASPRVSAPTSPRDEARELAGAETLTPEASPVAIRRSALADEWFWLRAKALEGEAPPPFADALAAMQQLRADLSQDPTAWEDLEVPLGTADRARDLVAAYGALPELRDVGGRVVPLRADALRVARAMEATERAYREGPWRAHAEEIDRAAADMKARFLPHVEEVLRAIEADMSLPGVARPIVLTFVGDAPYPGIFAADARGHASASFVRVRGITGGALVETILHEALHAIDELTVREPSTAMNALRAALARRGLDESDSDVEMAVNTVTFAEAASLVRRYVEPAHRPMGESGFYTLYPPAPAIVAAWDRHVSAGDSLDDTADAIAKAVAPP